MLGDKVYVAGDPVTASSVQQAAMQLAYFWAGHVQVLELNLGRLEYHSVVHCLHYFCRPFPSSYWWWSWKCAEQL